MCLQNFNTTLVTVQLSYQQYIYQLKIYFNTTLVTVQRGEQAYPQDLKFNFNTTLVTVQRFKIKKGVAFGRFQYNACYGSTILRYFAGV